MWALDGSPIANRSALSVMEAWKCRHHLHSDRWLPLGQAAYFGVQPLGPGNHLMLPATQLCLRPPRAVPFSALEPALQSTLVRRHPPPLSLRGLPQLVEPCEDTDVGVRWRSASSDEFRDACLFACRAGASSRRLLAAATMLTSPKQAAWSTAPVPILNIQETTNPFALDAALTHRHVVTQAALPPWCASGLTTVAAQFTYSSLMWLEADQLAAYGYHTLSEGRDQQPHPIPVLETVALYHVCQLSQEEQKKWLDRVPRFVLLNSLTTPFVLSRNRWLSARRFGLTTQPCIDDVHRVNPSLPRGSPQPLLWIAPWSAATEEEETHFMDGFAGPPLEAERNYSASFFNAAQIVKT